MKLSRCRLILFSFLLGTALMAARPVSADLGFSAAASTNSIVVSNTLTYTFNFTNFTGLAVTNVFLTNQLSFSMATNPPGWVTVTGTTMVLPIGTIPSGFILQTNWSSKPFVTGIPTNTVIFTNAVTLVAGGQGNVSTNLTTQLLIPQGDLGVSISVPTQGLLVGDVLAVDVTVTNLGPDTIPNVLLTNLLPTSFKLLTPTNLIALFTSSNLTVNLGSLVNLGSTNLHLTFQPTNSGVFPLDAVVIAASMVDTNLANNTAGTNVTIGAFLTNPGDLTLTVVTQRFNLLTGLLEVAVRLTNNTASPVPATRVLASGLPAGARLYNASGTNSGNGYALYNATLPANGTLDLVLEFYVLKVASFTNYVVSAFGVPPINLGTSTNNSVAVTGVAYSPGGFLIKFAATIGKTYTILYSDNADFSSAQTVQPSIVAPATQVQWIDNGPPKTAPPPTGGRFYRVIQNN